MMTTTPIAVQTQRVKTIPVNSLDEFRRTNRNPIAGRDRDVSQSHDQPRPYIWMSVPIGGLQFIEANQENLERASSGESIFVYGIHGDRYLHFPQDGTVVMRGVYCAFIDRDIIKIEGIEKQLREALTA
ncbi:MAG: hypothetical protein NTX24_00240 [Candidatus Pacearchaeota archaeon]|nr:hypothetical protein [Candidatus Pacearchaeota archaeon]